MRSTSRWTACSPKGWRTATPATWRWRSTPATWGKQHFGLFGDEKYLSPTVTHIANNGFDFGALNKELGKRGAQISDGYGPFKGKTFRIGHMGDLTLADVKWLTAQIDDILKL